MNQINGIFRIAARNKERTEAYAERLESYKFLPDGAVLCFPMHGSCYFGDIEDIVINPVIIRRCSGDWLYKIELKKEGE